MAIEDRTSTARSHRGSLNITFDGQTHTLTEWARITGLSYDLIRQRIVVLGWHPEEVLSGKTFDSISCPGCSKEFTPTRSYSKYCSVKCQKSQYYGPEPSEFETTGTTGAIGELLASAALLEAGIPVFRALSPSCPFDLAALSDGRLIGVEVRTGNTNRVTGRISFSTSHQKADVLAVRLRDPSVVKFFSINESGKEFLAKHGISDLCDDSAQSRQFKAVDRKKRPVG